jgi:hypothetical protein
MGNKKVLSKATRELNKTKRFAAPKNIIVDPKGQWAHPGEITRIPSDTITMQGVPYPVMAYPNIGEPQMMYPGGEYYYPGADYVDEYPQMQDGGAIPVIEDTGSYSAEGYWIPDWEAMKKQAKELNAKTVKTKSGSIIYFDSNWDVQNVDDNPQMKRGGTPKSLVKMPKPSKKGLASKKFSRSLEATNKLFTENYLFAKPKSRKRKVFDPNAAYYQEGGISTQEDIDDANNAMMKARLAYAYMHSNPAAQRMVVAPDQPYDFGDGNTGTHYMASMDEYAVPLIQDVNGQLMLGDFGPESAEAMRFDKPDDAQYFAEHYKEITPDESYRKEYPEEDYIETELTPEEIEEYRKGGFIVEDISVPQLTMQKGGDPDPKKKKTSRIEPFITSDPDEYAFRKAAYDDSLHAANKYNPKQPRTSKYNLYKPIVGKSFPGKRASVKRKYIPYIPRPLDTYDVSGESPAWEKFRRENMHLRDRMIENQPIGFVTEESVYDSRAIRTPFGIKTFTLPGEYQDKEFDRKPRYKRPVQPVIFKEPVTHQEKKKPVEHKYPTSRKPVVDNTKQKPPEGKIVVGKEEVQQLDPNTGVVTTVINPVYEDAMMPIQTLSPARVNHTLQKFIGEPFPTRVQEEIPEEELLDEELPEEEIPEEEMYGEEEVDGEYVDAGRRRLFPDIYVDTRGRKLKYTKRRLRKPGHSGDLIKKAGVDYMYFPKIERGPSTHFWMDYKQEGGEYNIGDEVELTEAEVKRLRALGYTIEEV